MVFKCILGRVLALFIVTFAAQASVTAADQESGSPFAVQKQVLDNGMTVLVLPNHHAPLISLQLWYGTGGKHEKDGERGIAHFIEHMIFKGTNTLSESDIMRIANKCSSYCNAATSNDYTFYQFDCPKVDYQRMLPIMADCMQNCTFPLDQMRSELKAVIQELKLYNDNYERSLMERMSSTIFHDHPYHLPLIGYREDLWRLDRDVLVNFYKRHYVPNNATLVIVGDVEPEEAFSYAEKAFGSLQPSPDYKRESFVHRQRVEATSTTLYRDVQQPLMFLAFEMPGTRARKNYISELLNIVCASGRSSRLYRLLVDELKLATAVSGFVEDAEDASLLYIKIMPASQDAISAIKQVVTEQLNALIEQGPSAAEVQRAVRKFKMVMLGLAENNSLVASLLGSFYVVLKDENYLANYTQYKEEQLAGEIQKLAARYCLPALMHEGYVLPLDPAAKKVWQQLQADIDAEDARVLGAIQRESDVAHCSAAHDVVPGELSITSFPQPHRVTLKNGLDVLYYHDPRLDKIECILDFKARNWYDAAGKEGLFTFVSAMLQEGTSNRSAVEFAQALEAFGMELNVAPGQISLSMLSKDFPQGMSFLHEIVTQATLPENGIEQVRRQLLAALDSYYDTPMQFVLDRAKQAVYADHPYRKNPLGTKQSITQMSRDDLLCGYKKYISPVGASLVIVGNLEGIDVADQVAELFASWQAQPLTEPTYPALAAVTARTITQDFNRDQITLCFAGLSVDRLDQDYDKLLIFNAIFGGSGSLYSRLFQLRMRTGLFYSAGFSLVAGADTQPGMIILKTLISPDRLDEAECAITALIDEAVDSLQVEEVEEAKRALIMQLIKLMASQQGIAAQLASAHRFNFPDSYLPERVEKIKAITLDEVKAAVRRVFAADKLVKIRIGRVPQEAAAGEES